MFAADCHDDPDLRLCIMFRLVHAVLCTDGIPSADLCIAGIDAAELLWRLDLDRRLDDPYGRQTHSYHKVEEVEELMAVPCIYVDISAIDH